MKKLLLFLVIISFWMSSCMPLTYTNTNNSMTEVYYNVSDVKNEVYYNVNDLKYEAGSWTWKSDNYFENINRKK